MIAGLVTHDDRSLKGVGAGPKVDCSKLYEPVINGSVNVFTNDAIEVSRVVVDEMFGADAVEATTREA